MVERTKAAGRPVIRGVLFDKDGTLFDFFATWVPAYETVARLTAGDDAALVERLLTLGGRDPVTGRIDPGSVLGAGTARQLAELWVGALGHGDVEALTRAYGEAFHSHGVTSAQPVTDLPALFDRLRARGLRLGLATMDSHAAAEATMAAFGLTGHLDFIAGFDTGHGIKPGPGMVTAFCAAVGLPPAEVAVVGDTPHDLEMAHAAGAGLAIGVLTGASPRARLQTRAHHVLDSIAGLEALLDRL
ncbi:MAG: HAD family hydrolase [Dongiaceae bacterium]